MGVFLFLTLILIKAIPKSVFFSIFCLYSNQSLTLKGVFFYFCFYSNQSPTKRVFSLFCHYSNQNPSNRVFSLFLALILTKALS